MICTRRGTLPGSAERALEGQVDVRGSILALFNKLSMCVRARLSTAEQLVARLMEMLFAAKLVSPP